MEALNSFEDIEQYKNFGVLSQPFLDRDYVYKKVTTDLKNKQKDESSLELLNGLCLWINHCVKCSKEESIQKQKFMRSAKEIWESGKTSGCTDYAILFVTFARQLGFATTFLHTAEYNWLLKLKKNQAFKTHKGHAFCECYINGKWVLVDPTNRKIEESYSSERIELSYKVGDSSIFIPYFRGLDLGQRQNTEIHNKIMDKLCSELEI